MSKEAKPRSRSWRFRASDILLTRTDLSPATRVVGQYFLNRANQNTGLAWPSITKLVAALHIDRSTVKQALANLRKAGVITDTGETCGSDPRYASKLYEVQPHELWKSESRGGDNPPSAGSAAGARGGNNPPSKKAPGGCARGGIDPHSSIPTTLRTIQLEQSSSKTGATECTDDDGIAAAASFAKSEGEEEEKNSQPEATDRIAANLQAMKAAGLGENPKTQEIAARPGCCPEYIAEKASTKSDGVLVVALSQDLEAWVEKHRPPPPELIEHERRKAQEALERRQRRQQRQERPDRMTVSEAIIRRHSPETYPSAWERAIAKNQQLEKHKPIDPAGRLTQWAPYLARELDPDEFDRQMRGEASERSSTLTIGEALRRSDRLVMTGTA
ncbi:MAG: helix-turn-helix domain-containing protein [Phycisphaerales bacterium]|nr:MAG: helix-turn-helix domain-containing protein [Phycisphaerales bacterium]